MKLDFKCNKNEVYVVTGASSGIGKNVCEMLSEAGARIVGVARNKEKLEEAMNSLKGEHFSLSQDVSDLKGLFNTVQSLGKDVGPFSGCVHCAGINEFTPLRGFNQEKASQILQTSLWGGIALIRAVTHKKTLSNDGASCVLLSSVAGMKGQVGLVAYGAAKAGVTSACKTMAKELASKNVRVNAVCPGWVDSKMTNKLKKTTPGGIRAVIDEHPLGIGQPSQVASAIMFLLSKEADWITGSTIVVDGGFLA